MLASQSLDLKGEAASKFRALASEIIAVLDEGATLRETYPLLRDFEQSRKAIFGGADLWPGYEIRFECLEDGRIEFHILTRHPTRDFVHEANFIEDTLTAEDENELRDHARIIINAWLRQAKTSNEPTEDDDSASLHVSDNSRPLFAFACSHSTQQIKVTLAVLEIAEAFENIADVLSSENVRASELVADGEPIWDTLSRLLFRAHSFGALGDNDLVRYCYQHFADSAAYKQQENLIREWDYFHESFWEWIGVVSRIDPNDLFSPDDPQPTITCFRKIARWCYRNHDPSGDIRQKRAQLEFWNSGNLSWVEISDQIRQKYGTEQTPHNCRVETQRFANKHGLHFRRGTPGIRKRKSAIS